MTYNDLIHLSRGTCKTLTYDKRAEFKVSSEEVTIIYQSGNRLRIPRDMVEEAISKLEHNHVLTDSDVYDITNKGGARTDRLLAVLRLLPGITFDGRPRKLYYQGPNT